MNPANADSRPNRKRAKRSQYIEYGGQTDKYTWDQWEDEIHVSVPGFAGVKTRDIECVLKKKYLKLQQKGKEAIFDGELHGEIDLDQSTWTILNELLNFLVDGVVEIILSKGVNSEIWWPVIQLGHPEIDVKAIDGAKYLDDSILKKIYEQKKAQKAEKEAGGNQENNTNNNNNNEEPK